MSQAAQKLPTLMTVAEFLDWPGDGTGVVCELVDGVVRAQDPASDTHGTIHGNLAAIVRNHLIVKRPGCRLVVAPGVQPRLRSSWNYRVPELGVTCVPNTQGQRMAPDPILLIEILSPSNVADTWGNIALYATLPSVVEILIVDSSKVRADVLRRGSDGSWAQDPEVVTAGGTIRLTSIGLEMTVGEVYFATHLATET